MEVLSVLESAELLLKGIFDAEKLFDQVKRHLSKTVQYKNFIFQTGSQTKLRTSFAFKYPTSNFLGSPGNHLCTEIFSSTTTTTKEHFEQLTNWRGIQDNF